MRAEKNSEFCLLLTGDSRGRISTPNREATSRIENGANSRRDQVSIILVLFTRILTSLIHHSFYLNSSFAGISQPGGGKDRLRFQVTIVISSFTFVCSSWH